MKRSALWAYVTILQLMMACSWLIILLYIKAFHLCVETYKHVQCGEWHLLPAHVQIIFGNHIRCQALMKGLR